jgi:hypothetical protein
MFNIKQNILTGLFWFGLCLLWIWLSQPKQYHCEYPSCEYPANKPDGPCAYHQAIEDNFTYDDSERELYVGPGGNAPALYKMSYL